MNETMTEYIVTFTTSRQISEDRWDVYHPSMKVTEDTTVKEIDAFYHEHIPKGNMVEVTLIELETK